MLPLGWACETALVTLSASGYRRDVLQPGNWGAWEKVIWFEKLMRWMVSWAGLLIRPVFNSGC